MPEIVASRKRPAPSRTKKGTATAAKKAPPSKKRKLEVPRSETPASRVSKAPTLKAASSQGSPANSSPARSTRSYSAEADDEPYGDEADPDEDVEGDGAVYCICRKPDNGTFMIGCDGPCEDWFHGKCVSVEERDKDLIDRYICPNCTKAGVGRTAWKRVCRRSGCRKPARASKGKSGKEGSKYCSEECGVLYFREMVARTRNREDTVKNRSNRRKSSLVSTDKPDMDDDLGAKGGVLSAGEVKSLVNASKTAEDFKKLGEGVLSPPATPDGKETADLAFTEAETTALEQIRRSKEEARRRHQLLKDRMKFVTMVKQAGSRTATERDLKPKEYCGYDPRIEWTEEQFATWRDSTSGKQAFELETLAVENSGKEHTDYGGGHDVDMEGANDDSIYAQIAICDRKKCARHLEWGKLAVDDLRFEMGDNSDNMRALEKEEKDLRERAALRAKIGASFRGEGEVEVHRLDIVSGGNEEDMGVVGGENSVEAEGSDNLPPPPAAPVAGGEAMEVDAAA
ncbi:hypothetical protein BAUCODRAFT_61204 [Baudoinia panamericana UAMH 10762]|uniref:PHD-type domain-containing protein n=1 Tax=Baudoinia panamericana (strain UAMH 10762) TaxID=717646 RepID=M2NNQ9_BAUPA|nr:uncharacterized protein BAUCODRAFT_61204 [Baudoinia panamericana UAMH 10762]EMD01160.1 hypothetical protein BAUCODRAFT_61204 [Baudoinia panamericana UAMH 10762]